MTRVSLHLGWSRARAARRLLAGVWLGRLVIALPLALALAAGLVRRAPAVAAPPADPVLEAEAAFALGRAVYHAPAAYLVLLAATLLAGALWEVIWQGGLAARGPERAAPGLRRTLADGLAILRPLLLMALLGLALQVTLAGLGALAGLPLASLGRRGPWWTAPVVVVLRLLAAVLAWLLAVAAVQRARLAVAAGRPPLAAMFGALRSTLRTPLASLAATLAWLAWSLAWAGLWLLARLLGTVATPAGAAVALGVLALVVLMQVWGRAALLLTFAGEAAPAPRAAPASSGGGGSPTPAPAPASAPAA